MIEELSAKTIQQWQAFREKLECEDLDCSTVSVAEIMGWYSEVLPPFGPEKRREFPDAFAMAALRDYTQTSDSLRFTHRAGVRIRARRAEAGRAGHDNDRPATE